MRFLFSFFIIVSFNYSVVAQELFPMTQPASSVPKGAFGVWAFGNSYKEVKLYRNLGALRVMYGVTARLSVMVTASEANHHGDSLPYNLVTHTHLANGATVYNTSSIVRGLIYPYHFNGIDVYAKYRFFSADAQKKHFRMSVYAEWSNVNEAHDETEPTLLDDTKGVGGGLIMTMLRNRFAASLTTGVIIPGSYQETRNLTHWTGLLGNTTTQIQYGNAVQYDLSFGYRISPKVYEDYHDDNWNVYLEFMGKSYEGAKVIQNGVPVQVQTPLLEAGNFVEVYPGIQRIIDSNWRIDLSVGLPFIGVSYVHFYPVYQFGIQRYFYLKNRSGRK